MRRLSFLLILWAAPAHSDSPSRGPYFVEASSTAARVCWRFGPKRSGDGCRRLRGLTPGATFSYKIYGSTATWIGQALPPAGAPLRFAVFGDSGEGRKQQYWVADALKRWAPDLILHTGDIVYPSGKDKHYNRKYFRPYRRLLSRIPLFPALGNHDYGNTGNPEKGAKRFRKHYARIHRRPKYYSFDAGSAHFVSLDNNNEGDGITAAAPIRAGSPQARWLERDLASSSAPWKIVFLHIPIYTAHHHGDQPALQKELEPVFRRHKVDVVFQGHNHHYERLKPISGIQYVTSGTGGARLYELGGKKPFSAEQLSEYGFVGVTLRSDSLLLEFIDYHGRVRDRHIIKKGAPDGDIQKL